MKDWNSGGTNDDGFGKLFSFVSRRGLVLEKGFGFYFGRYSSMILLTCMQHFDFWVCGWDR